MQGPYERATRLHKGVWNMAHMNRGFSLWLCECDNVLLANSMAVSVNWWSFWWMHLQ